MVCCIVLLIINILYESLLILSFHIDIRHPQAVSLAHALQDLIDSSCHVVWVQFGLNTDTALQKSLENVALREEERRREYWEEYAQLKRKQEKNEKGDDDNDDDDECEEVIVNIGDGINNYDGDDNQQGKKDSDDDNNS